MQWKRFYELADRLFTLAPWAWMYDVDLFGVKDPVSGEIGYCGFLGSGGGIPGFALFRGNNGLFSYERMIEQNPEHVKWLESYQLDGLLLTFRESDSLNQQEIEELSMTGVEPGRRGLLPVLRDHVPGMMPWKVESPDMVSRMVTALEQALIIADRFRTDPDLLDDTDGTPGRILVRVPHSDEEWTETWIQEPIELSLEDTGDLLSLFLKSRCADQPNLRDEWFADVFYVPKPIILGQERPYLPQMVLLVSQDSQKVLGSGQFQPGDTSRRIEEFFVNTVERAGGLPKAIIATRPESYRYWWPVASALGLDIKLRSEELILEELKASYFDSFAI